jgi:hypothetical protein
VGCKDDKMLEMNCDRVRAGSGKIAHIDDFSLLRRDRTLEKNFGRKFMKVVSSFPLRPQSDRIDACHKETTEERRDA